MPATREAYIVMFHAGTRGEVARGIDPEWVNGLSHHLIYPTLAENPVGPATLHLLPVPPYRGEHD